MAKGQASAEKQVQSIPEFAKVIEMYENKIAKAESINKLIFDSYKEYVLGKKNLAEFLQIVNMQVQINNKREEGEAR